MIIEVIVIIERDRERQTETETKTERDTAIDACIYRHRYADTYIDI